MQTVSFGDNLHEMSNPVSWKKFPEKKNKKTILKCHLLKIDDYHSGHSLGSFSKQHADVTFIFLENILTFGYKLHEMSEHVSWEKYENICWKFNI